MVITVSQLAKLVGGQLRGTSGDVVIRGAATLDAVGADQITLLDAAQRLQDWHRSAAAAAVVPADLPAQDRPTIAVADVHAAFTQIIAHFRPSRRTPRTGVSPAAAISPTAQLENDVSVHPGATIGDRVKIERGTTIHSGVHIMADCAIGADVTIFPGAVLYENTCVGPRSIIHSGAVLGAHGFGYQLVDGSHRGTAQLGWVEVGADVEIGACTTIDRGTYDATVIGAGTKIDNQVMIAHNCRLGRHNMICSQVGIAGSTSTGDYVVMAGQVGVRDHVHIGTGDVLGAKDGVSNDLADGARMIGIPATPEREQKLKQAALAKLPEMRKQWKQLVRQLALPPVDRGSRPQQNEAAA
jgi:UDP-3-O-[3-hydroxymyristoyl] glucosamine N-acyltransferase